jgi:hypothetical protein
VETILKEPKQTIGIIGNMNVAFLTEMSFHGKIPMNHPNMRTEFAWFHALDADHFNVREYASVSKYDWVFLILPKGGVGLNMEGIRLNDAPNRYSDLYASSFIKELKANNRKVAYVQEGPTHYVNDFYLTDQITFFNSLAECDVIFAHNVYDKKWYEGLFPSLQVTTIPTLMIEELVRSLSPKYENKAIIGGNFCRWYGGFQSYMVAQEFGVPVSVQTSHCSQPGEDQLPNLNILPRLTWIEWMKNLSTYKYAVHLMPTIAAGTFSLNCAYFGIPCIGNIKVDTQRTCFPDLSVEAEDVKGARELAVALKEDKTFFNAMSDKALDLYQRNWTIDSWRKHMIPFLEKNL